MKTNEYFMNIAQAVALKSKDPSTQVGSLIIDNDNRIVSTGYNGFVAGCDEQFMTQNRPMKYQLVIHSELNTLLYARRDVRGFKLFTTHGPCANCLKHILQAGIREVYYKDAGVVRDRGTLEEKEAITRLIQSTGARVINVDSGEEYEIELA